jgi:Zn-dependent peptidase ImmA (M78 family)
VPLHPSHLLNIARKRARTTRERYGVPALGPVPDLVALAEGPLRLPVVVAALPEAVDGAYLPGTGAPRGATVFVNGRRPLVRQRFTLAHELGHHVLGHGSSVDDAGALDPDGAGQGMEERCANAFAAELLIPQDAARAWVQTAAPAVRKPPVLEDVVRFAAAFGVSASMACIRLRTAKLVDAPTADALLAVIEEHEHLALAERLDGLPVLQDTLAAVAAHGGTRLPAAFAGSIGALRL